MELFCHLLRIMINKVAVACDNCLGNAEKLKIPE
jgi:hypothetical protein